MLHLVNSIIVATLSAASGKAMRHCGLFCEMQFFFFFLFCFYLFIFFFAAVVAPRRTRCGPALSGFLLQSCGRFLLHKLVFPPFPLHLNPRLDYRHSNKKMLVEVSLMQSLLVFLQTQMVCLFLNKKKTIRGWRAVLVSLASVV